ncbi:hypothetical protein BKH41_03670 [Helicobacter sp. 12S02232-10]|uniref:hypothetical protein n=1 Tax=Helicobacter sp. 12S02232-10 TaxID=1476197 RepID=UPI000BA6CB06|nr:hypothetical protein [Helicobacter sp. 12S02232-10]PAF49191.1 hypothetical protein BKH41_03670 [Helicobacter sp. 12S02232-10]
MKKSNGIYSPCRGKIAEDFLNVRNMCKKLKIPRDSFYKLIASSKKRKKFKNIKLKELIDNGYIIYVGDEVSESKEGVEQ